MSDSPDAPGRSSARYEEFVSLFVANQSRLHAFLRAFLPTWADVDEVMQETSLVAWRKFDRFETGSNFMAWASAIARFEALDHLRRRGRDKLVFSDAVIELVANEGLEESEKLGRERDALEECLEKLSSTQRELLLLSYQPGARLNEVAAQAGRSVQGYYKSVQRLRGRLLECIHTTMAKESA